MAFYDKFPYTNFQELNLDNIAESIESINNSVAEATAQAEAAAESEANAKQSETNAETYKNAAAESAAEAAADAAAIANKVRQIDTNTARIAENTAAINLNSARIDGLLVEGTPTEGNAELIDIRTAFDGFTYPTAGDSVRAQAGNLNYEIERALEYSEFDWSLLGSDSNSRGWVGGFYATSNGQANTTNDQGTIRTTSLIRPAVFNTDYDAFGIVTPPSGYWMRLAVFDANGTFIESINTGRGVDIPFLLKLDGTRQYGITMGDITGELPAALTDELIASIKLHIYQRAASLDALEQVQGDISSLIDAFPKYTFNWRKFGSASFPLGWRVGYYDVADGSTNNTNTNYMRTRDKLSINNVPESTAFCKITPPSGYYILVAVFDRSTNTYIETLNAEYREIDKTITFEFDPDKTYAFSLAYFGPNYSRDYITDEFIDSIKLEIFASVGDVVKNDSDPTRTYIYNSSLDYALKLPSNYAPTGAPTTLIILCHGVSSTITADNWSAENIAAKFTTQGYAVMDVDEVTTQDWCNPDLIRKYIAALHDIVTDYNVVPKFVYGYSMGSLIGLCMASTVPGIKAAAISGIRLDLEARYNELTAAEKAVVDDNLGFTDGFDYYKTAGWCKTAFACPDMTGSPVNPIQFPPTIFVYGSTDDLTKTESLAKIEEIKRGGTICTANEYTGGHSAVCDLTAGTSLADVLNWFDTYK